MTTEQLIEQVLANADGDIDDQFYRGYVAGINETPAEDQRCDLGQRDCERMIGGGQCGVHTYGTFPAHQ